MNEPNKPQGEDLEVPEWLDEFLREASQCIECIPGEVEWVVDFRGEDGWGAHIYPSAVILKGQKVHPEANIDLSDVAALYDDNDEGPNSHWGHDGLTICGTVKGTYVWLTADRMAPEDVPARIQTS